MMLCTSGHRLVILQSAAAEDLPSEGGRLASDRSSLAAATVNHALLVCANLKRTRLKLLVICWTQASVT